MVISLPKPALVLTLVAALAFPGAGAFHAIPEPLIDSVAFDGVHWVAWRVQLASPGRISVEGWSNVTNAEILSVMVTLMQGDGSDPDTGGFIQQVATTHTFVQTTGDAPVVDMRSGLGAGFVGAGVSWAIHPAGEYLVVGVLSGLGSLTGGKLDLHADGDATIVARTEGDTSFAAVARHFQGTLNARTGTPTAMATAIVDGSHAETIDNRLFAFFWRHPPTSANPLHSVTCEIRYDGPDGGGAGLQYYYLDNAPPGGYTFRVPHCAEVGAGPFRSQLFVVGADVELPP